jgi:ubiquitin carboxyl-terminal hydrolase 8
MKNKGLCGFHNIGNTCYLNTALQCLIHTYPLTEYFLSTNFDNKNILVNEFTKLISVINDENCTISPNSLIKSVMKRGHEKKMDIKFLLQNDVQEFLIFFIDELHEEIKKNVTMTITGRVLNDTDKMALKSMKSWNSFFKNNYSKIIELFYGQTVSIIKVNNIVKSENYGPLCFFSLPIPINLNNNNINIYDCFDLFCKTELLRGDNQWKCDKTNKYYDADQITKIWKYPQIMIINLKRFDFNQNKINVNIDFPIQNLNLSNFCIGYNNNKSIYDLYAICNHKGRLNNGHYYAYCKHKNNKWYSFNDSDIKEIKEESLITNKAYCLFYKLKK